MKRTLSIIILIISCYRVLPLSAQTVVQIEPLFEYPVAPEELESLEEKCNYLVKNFWNNFNFKSKASVDQYALNEAFSVFVTPMRYASDKETTQAVEKLIGKISGNPILLFQFTKAAEENLYGPRADFWSDSLYLKFLEAIIKNKKISDNRKSKYINQAGALTQSTVDNLAPSFDFVNMEGEQKNYFPMSTPTLLIFGNPDDTEWRLSRLKMDSNFKLEDALEKGKVNILYIIPAEMPGWQESLSNYNKRWTLGESKDINKIYDIRLNPTIFIIGTEGKILKKFATVEEAFETVLQLVN